MRTELTREALQEALDTEGTVQGAAAKLGVSRYTIYRWMSKHDIRMTRRVVKRAA